jgi:hypothetical protein
LVVVAQLSCLEVVMTYSLREGKERHLCRTSCLRHSRRRRRRSSSRRGTRCTRWRRRRSLRHTRHTQCSIHSRRRRRRSSSRRGTRCTRWKKRIRSQSSKFFTPCDRCRG